MELKVLMNGEERTVSGINETTTCKDIIIAIAKASSQNGKYEMIEKFRNIEKRLGSQDKPLDILQKWKENASNVTFILKRISDEDDDGTYDTIGPMRSPGYTTPLPTYRQPSTSSIASTVQAPNTSLTSNQWSSSSLPVMSNIANANANYSQIQRRPPPPDYKTVMEQKYASLSRGPQARPALPTEVGENAIANMKLSPGDLKVLIESQRITLEQQKENLSNKEMLKSDGQRELLQLQRQQENLRLVLQPLIKGNWTQQYQQEFKRSQKLKASIEATKEAIDKAKSDLSRLNKEEENLKQQIQAFKAENPNASFTELQSLGEILKESPEKSPRKIPAY